MLLHIFKYLVFGCFFLLSSNLFSREGMWLPFLIEQGIVDEMQEMGCELSKRELYNEDSTSLKDAILLFGSGCTASYISGEGLILTNHHCARGAINSHTTEENPLLLDGYWSASRDMELKIENLDVKVLVKVEDYSDYIDDELREDEFLPIAKKITDSIEKISPYYVKLESFFGGRKHYLITYRKYTDVRLVAAVPETVGNFGNDSDNWSWPRHSADFAILRVYEKDSITGEPVPVKPKKYLEVNGAGVQENQFTMVYGFPGRTREYLPAVSVDSLANVINPLFVSYRDVMLRKLKVYMKKSPKHELKYTPVASRVSNYWKKWQGESWGIEQSNAVGNKLRFEDSLRKIIPEVDSVLDQIEKQTALYTWNYTEFIHFFEGFFKLKSVLYLDKLNKIFESTDVAHMEEALKERITKYKQLDSIDAFDLDKGYYKYIYDKYYDQENVNVRLLYMNIKGDHEKLFEESGFMNTESFIGKIQKVIDHIHNEKRRTRAIAAVKNEPLYLFSNNLKSSYRKDILQHMRMNKVRYFATIDGYKRILYDNDMMPYPDANSSLRFSFGKVEGYWPKDAVYYTPFTTVDGMLYKHEMSPVTHPLLNDFYSFLASAETQELVQKHDVKICFLASNHTTGGNSGSPVLDGEGRLVGLNFDRNWEGTMSDINYDVTRCRNISVDIRFVLFVLKYYGKMDYLLNEMEIKNCSFISSMSLAE